MIKTPEKKTTYKILCNIIQPLWLTTSIFYRKLNLSDSLYIISLIALITYFFISSHVRKGYDAIEDSKSEILLLIESITSNVAIGINIIGILMIIFWRGI